MTNDSTVILECYYAKACSDGMTGAPDYCRQGYEGACKLLGYRSIFEKLVLHLKLNSLFVERLSEFDITAFLPSYKEQAEKVGRGRGYWGKVDAYVSQGKSTCGLCNPNRDEETTHRTCRTQADTQANKSGESINQ